MTCSCCSSCCDDSTGECELNLQHVCDIAAQNMAIGDVFDEGDTDHQSVCDCTEEGTSFTCTDSICQSCTEDGTICGINTDYGHGLDEGGNIISYKTSFQYVKGRNETVTIEKSKMDDVGCRVKVDGEECASCSMFSCADNAVGVQADCTNVVEDEDAVHSTCTGLHDEGGVLEVFHMFFSDSFSGCRPTLQPLINL